MKLKMAEKSLFAILLRSSWWVSIAAAAGIALVSRMLLPEKYVLGGVVAALPFLGIGLVTAWRQLRAPKAADVASVLAAVEAMSSREFAGALEDAFRREGYSTRRIEPGTVDLEITKAGRTSLVSCKRWKAASTGVETLRELLALTEARNADEGIHVAVGGITNNARAFVAGKKLRLLEGIELAQLMRGVRRERLRP